MCCATVIAVDKACNLVIRKRVVQSLDSGIRSFERSICPTATVAAGRETLARKNHCGLKPAATRGSHRFGLLFSEASKSQGSSERSPLLVGGSDTDFPTGLRRQPGLVVTMLVKLWRTT